MSLCRFPTLLIMFLTMLSVGTSFALNGTPRLEPQVDRVFAAYDNPHSPGCALGVIRNGAFLYKRGYGLGSLELSVPLTSESVFYMGSVSKQFTAASVVLAAEQGYLSLDDDVSKYIPELPSYGHPITLRQMLHHTSGFRDVLALLQLAGRNYEDIHPTAELLALISRQRALNFSPGDEYLYSNTNYWLMGVIIQRSTGTSLSQFADENIFKPLGMAHTRFYEDRTAVVPGRVPAYESLASGGFGVGWSTNYDKVGDGGLLSSVEDLLKWDQNFYANKLGKGTLLRELQTQGVLNDGKRIQYALGVNMSSYRGLPIVEHGGSMFGYRTELLRFPKQKFSVICLCNVGSSHPRLLANQVADIYLNAELAPVPSHTVFHEDPQRLAGHYRNLQSHAAIEVTADHGALIALGQHFEPVGPREFVSALGDRLRFGPSGGGPSTLTVMGSSDDEAPEYWASFRPLTLAANELTQFVGTYESTELQATYTFAVIDGHLTLATNWKSPSVLEPTIRDEFQGPDDMSVVFHRNVSGSITGFDAFGGRVRQISFARSVLPVEVSKR